MEEISCSDIQEMAHLEYWYMNSFSIFVIHLFSAQESEAGTGQHQENLMQMNRVPARCMQRGHLVAMSRYKSLVAWSNSVDMEEARAF